MPRSAKIMTSPPTLFCLCALWLGLLSPSACSRRTTEQPVLRLPTGGQSVVAKSLDQLKQLVAPVQLTIDDPHERRQLTYEALPLANLLRSLSDGSAVTDVIVHCADGYAATLAHEVWRDHGQHAYLAFRLLGRTAFRVRDRDNGKQVALGPYYLIWDNRRHPELAADLPASAWPYQVISIEPVDLAQHLAALRPPSSAPAQAHQGFVLFRRHCLACHSVNRRGGTVGPELNDPVSVTSYFEPEWLLRWIIDPRQLRYNAKMPGLHGLGDAQQEQHTARQIVAYLESMAGPRSGRPAVSP